MMPELNEDRINYETNLQIGDTVLTRKTGLPGMGKVIGIQTGPLYVAHHKYLIIGKENDDGSETLKCVNQQGNQPCQRWDDLYPEWFLSPICTVKFEALQRIMSYQEFRDSRQWDENVTEDAIKAYYDIECPQTNVIAYPVSDLEKFE